MFGEKKEIEKMENGKKTWKWKNEQWKKWDARGGDGAQEQEQQQEQQATDFFNAPHTPDANFTRTSSHAPHVTHDVNTKHDVLEIHETTDFCFDPMHPSNLSTIHFVGVDGEGKNQAC